MVRVGQSPRDSLTSVKYGMIRVPDGLLFPATGCPPRCVW